MMDEYRDQQIERLSRLYDSNYHYIGKEKAELYYSMGCRILAPYEAVGIPLTDERMNNFAELLPDLTPQYRSGYLQGCADARAFIFGSDS